MIRREEREEERADRDQYCFIGEYTNIRGGGEEGEREDEEE